LEDRYNEDIYVDEGIDLAIRAIKSAMERDAFSGNGIRVATITKDEGFKVLSEEEVEKKIMEL
jgi:proteasome beta subunit